MLAFLLTYGFTYLMMRSLFGVTNKKALYLVPLAVAIIVGAATMPRHARAESADCASRAAEFAKLNAVFVANAKKTIDEHGLDLARFDNDLRQGDKSAKDVDLATIKAMESDAEIALQQVNGLIAIRDGMQQNNCIVANPAWTKLAAQAVSQNMTTIALLKAAIANRQ